MIAIRENETLAESVGVPTWRYKLVVFMLSAVFAGVGGSIYAHYLTVVSPLTFQMYYSTTMLIIVLGGGAGTISGVVFGSLLFVGLSEALRVAPKLRMIAYGLCLLILVFWFPKGFAPLLNRFWSFLGGAQMTVSADPRNLRTCTKSYGAVRAVDDVSLHVDRGEICGLIGPNGSGKSTFFDCCIRPRQARLGQGQARRAGHHGWSLNRIAREGRMLRSFQKTVVFKRPRRRGKPDHRRADVHLSRPVVDLQPRRGCRASASRLCASGRANSSRSPGCGTCAIAGRQPVGRAAEAHPVRVDADAGAQDHSPRRADGRDQPED